MSESWSAQGGCAILEAERYVEDGVGLQCYHHCNLRTQSKNVGNFSPVIDRTQLIFGGFEDFLRGRKPQPKNHGVATLQGTAVSGNLINFNLPGITETENKLIYNLRTQSKNESVACLWFWIQKG